MFDYFDIQFKTDKEIKLEELNDKLDICRRGQLTESSMKAIEAKKGD